MLFTGKSISGRGRSALGGRGGKPFLVAGAALLAVGVIGQYGPADEAAAAPGAQAGEPHRPAPLAWGECHDLPPAPPGGPAPRSLECAELMVPLDYSEPRGKTMKVALIRLRATDRAHRIGSLVFNFGGPGGSGIDAFAGGSAAQFKKLGTRYDLVSFDPRGVGRSRPVHCVGDKRKDEWLAMDTSPDNAREKAALLYRGRAFVKGCAKRSGKTLPHVGTVAAARDLDMIRIALGERKLNYFGFSYGTWLGAEYAHRFPEKVGRTVLDGAVNTELNPLRFFREQAAGFQRALGHFGTWAAQQPQAEPNAKAKGLTKDAVVTRVAALLQGLDTKPIPTDTRRELTQSLGEAGVLTGLYSKAIWPALWQAIQQAESGDGTILLALSDALFQRSPDGHYTNYLDASGSIYCASTPQRYTERDVAKALPAFTKASPVFGPTLAWRQMNCTGWPVKGTPTHHINAPGAPPILVIGNTGDPATPYAWAPALAEQLGSGVLLTLNGEGHTSYMTGNPCIQKAVNTYLLHGKSPVNGTKCQ
ncbi:alpha/beta hydrolase [Streptomyces sp. NPDC001480]|uniref:alpha/beta hydrolase n=1 Tax=Streptomyces sp. NPDC001480 TaxID=3364577 RepID=UPI00368F45CA